MKIQKHLFLFVSFVCFVGTCLAVIPVSTSQQQITDRLNLAAISDPASPAAGDLWLSSTTADTLKYRSGGTTYTLATTAALAAGYQPLDSDLTSIAALTTTSFGRALLALADEAALKAYVNLEIGTDVQAYDADLTTYAGITPSANIQSLLGSADYAAARTNLGLAIGTNIQAYDAALAALAAGSDFVQFTGPTTSTKIFTLPDASSTLLYSGGALGTPSSGTLTNATGLPVASGISGLGTGIATALAVNTGSAGAPVLFNGDAGTPSALVGTNISGTAASLTAGTVTTNANLTGDVTSTGNATTVVAINGTNLAGLATGLLKNTTSTGVPSIASAGTDYYAPGGTDVSLADGGTGASLTDPAADRILFWDDSAGAATWLAPGNSIAITTTTLDTVQDLRTTGTPTFATLILSTASVGNLFQASSSAQGSYLLSSVDSNGRIFLSVYGDHTGANGGAYFTANGKQESYFNVVTRSNPTNSQYMRFGNSNSSGGIFVIQALNDPANTVLRTPFSISNTAPSGSLSIGAAGNISSVAPDASTSKATGAFILSAAGAGLGVDGQVSANVVKTTGGSSTAYANLAGPLYQSTTAAGNITTGVDDLITQAIAANTLATTGDRLRITALVSLAGNVNSKEVIALYGATTCYDTTALLLNGGTIWIEVIVTRTGAATQNIEARVNSSNSTLASTANFTTAAETLSGSVTFKLTGEAVSTDDIIQRSLLVEYLPAP